MRGSTDKNIEVASTTKACLEAKDNGGTFGTSMATIERIITKSTQMVSKKVSGEADMTSTDVVPKEAAAKTLASKTGKAEASSETEKSFDIMHLGGSDLRAEELFKLQDFAIAGGYGFDFVLFGGVDVEVLGCLPNQVGAKIVNTLTKSTGFPNLENEQSNYRNNILLAVWCTQISWYKVTYAIYISIIAKFLRVFDEQSF